MNAHIHDQLRPGRGRGEGQADRGDKADPRPGAAFAIFPDREQSADPPRLFDIEGLPLDGAAQAGDQRRDHGAGDARPIGGQHLAISIGPPHDLTGSAVAQYHVHVKQVDLARRCVGLLTATEQAVLTRRPDVEIDPRTIYVGLESPHAGFGLAKAALDYPGFERQYQRRRVRHRPSRALKRYREAGLDR